MTAGDWSDVFDLTQQYAVVGLVIGFLAAIFATGLQD